MPRRSAGLLLWRRRADGVEVLLVHPGGPLFARRDVWGVPKGELDAGEDALAAAYREFAEETGFTPPGGHPLSLGEARQRSGKIDAAWALEGDADVSALVSNDFSLQWPPGSGRWQDFPEVDRGAWFGLPVAREKIFPSQLPFLDRLAALVAG